MPASLADVNVLAPATGGKIGHFDDIRTLLMKRACSSANPNRIGDAFNRRRSVRERSCGQQQQPQYPHQR